MSADTTTIEIDMRLGQQIRIGDGLGTTIEYLGNPRGQARLGIVAPPEVRVDREEVARARRGASVSGERGHRDGNHPDQ